MIPAPLKIPDYRAFWLARLATTIAQMAMVIVIGWQVYDIARETMSIREAAFQLGLIGLVQFVPLFVLTPISGWTADRLDRRYIARAVVSLEMLCALILFLATWGGFISLPILFGVAALLGVARAFAGPALGALAPNLVPREILPQAIALSSTAWQTGAIAGPAIGGILYDITPHFPYALSAVLFAFSVALPVHHRPDRRERALKPGSPLRQMVDGLAYVRRNRLVLGAITLDLFAVLLGGATAMLPVYARDILHVGADGPRPAARGAGGRRDADRDLLLDPAAQDRCRRQDARRGRRVRRGDRGLRLVDARMPLSLAMLALLGAADMFSVYIRQSLIQLHTPDEMRGRVGGRLDAGHLRLERARRDAQRLRRRAARPGRRDRRRRRRGGRGHLALGRSVPRAAPGPDVRAAGDRRRKRRRRRRRRLTRLQNAGRVPICRHATRRRPRHEGRQHPRDHRQHAAHPHQPPVRRPRRGVDQVRSGPIPARRSRTASRCRWSRTPKRSGKLKPGGMIVEPTSGNTGIGLAMVAAVKGYTLILVMPDSMSIERRRLMLAYGATFDLTPREKGMKGAIARAAGDRRRDRRRVDAAAVREPRQPRSPPPHHGAGDPARLSPTRRSTR